jgi:hypothetical protein
MQINTKKYPLIYFKVNIAEIFSTKWIFFSATLLARRRKCEKQIFIIS